MKKRPTSGSSPWRLDAVETIARLGDLGPPSEIRRQSPAVAAAALAFDRVLLATASNGLLIAEALHLQSGNAVALLEQLRQEPVPLDYPLVEGEIMRRRRAQIVRVSAATSGQHAFDARLRWSAYAAAPIVLEGRVTGFFLADRVAGGTIADQDAANLATFAAYFALLYERAVLRQRLSGQLQEMREFASRADARASELGIRPVTLDEHDESVANGAAERHCGVGEGALRELLTRRELEVLKLMVRGGTNGAIARELVVSEGTVKFHVKNILRKLHASNRAEATSRYLRLTLHRNGAARVD